MFILIFDDGKVMKAADVSDEDKQCADNGILDIIKQVDLTQYYDGAWHELEEISAT